MALLTIITINILDSPRRVLATILLGPLLIVYMVVGRWGVPAENIPCPFDLRIVVFVSGNEMPSGLL